MTQPPLEACPLSGLPIDQLADQGSVPLVTLVAPAAEFHAASLVLELNGTHLMDLPGGAAPGWVRFTAPTADLDRVRSVLADVAPRARPAG